MNESLESRLRAHFADRVERESLPGQGVDAALPNLERFPASRWSRWRRPPLLAAAAAVVATIVLSAVLVLGGDGDEVNVVATPTTAGTATTATTTPTSPSTTTTAPADSALPLSVAVIVGVDGVLGIWDGERWVQWAPGVSLPIEGGEEYQVIGVGRPTVRAAGSEQRPGCPIGDDAAPRIDYGIDYERDPLVPDRIAVSGVAEPEPRPVVPLPLDSAVYQEIAIEILADLGVDDPDPALVQLLRTDLEGDGVDEILLTVERLSDGLSLFAAPGDYSVLALRRVIDGQAVVTLLSSSVVPTAPPEDATPYIGVARVAAVADLNGDGRMEIAVDGSYYEGHGTEVFDDPRGAEPVAVLSVGCGA